ncbi:MAG: hypothetical protein ABUL44_02840 [Flavobacterium sp.]
MTKHEIIERIKKGELLTNPFRKENQDYDVEPASYDLRAGIIIWKEYNPITKESHIKRKDYDSSLPLSSQDTVTLQPGQVMFVITHEEIIMPTELCGTVYAKNRFSRDGILALTTGHVDPGIQCPIVIRLINLRSIPFTFSLGEQIYTIVFHNLELNENIKLEKHPPITLQKTIERTIESANAALGNALYDLSLTQEYVKKDEFQQLKDQSLSFIKLEDCGKVFSKFIFKKFWAWVLLLFALIGVFASVLKIIDFFKN